MISVTNGVEGKVGLLGQTTLLAGTSNVDVDSSVMDLFMQHS